MNLSKGVSDDENTCANSERPEMPSSHLIPLRQWARTTTLKHYFRRDSQPKQNDKSTISGGGGVVYNTAWNEVMLTRALCQMQCK